MMMITTDIRSTESIERLEMAATHCMVLASCLETSSGTSFDDALEALAQAVGMRDGPAWDDSFASVAVAFDDGAVSPYERGVGMVTHACGEGPAWVYEAQRDCYADILATVFGITSDEVLHDVERLHTSYAAVDAIEDRWL